MMKINQTSIKKNEDNHSVNNQNDKYSTAGNRRKYSKKISRNKTKSKMNPNSSEKKVLIKKIGNKIDLSILKKSILNKLEPSLNQSSNLKQNKEMTDKQNKSNNKKIKPNEKDLTIMDMKFDRLNNSSNKLYLNKNSKIINKLKLANNVFDKFEKIDSIFTIYRMNEKIFQNSFSLIYKARDVRSNLKIFLKIFKKKQINEISNSKKIQVTVFYF